MSDDTRFFGFLKNRIGLDVASVGEAIVERAVRQRCSQANAADHDAYWLLLLGSAEEQQALIEAVIVPETWFFRYPESFVTLGKLAAARLAQLNGARPLRILSLPCSTGEEPYSIVMALLDAGLQAQQFKVEAVDISPLSLQRARRAVYGKNSFRGEDLGFRQRYFTQVDEGYRVEDRVCERVGFQAGNLLDPALPVAQSAYDFVFCRNLLIYFDVDTQRRGFEALKRMTRDDGVLFIGPAEGSLLGRMGMASIGVAQSFAFRHRAEPVAESTPAPVAPARSESLAINARPTPPAAPRAKTSVRPFAASPRTPASPAVDNSEATTLLDSVKRLANEGKSAQAKAACEQYLKRFEPVARVFYWQGLLAEVEGDAAGAQGFYRKALYLEPQHPEALAQLAALLAAQGDTAGARRLQERAARGVNKEGRNR
jgi:chemotaxis protein methyltransferase WspC